MRLSRRRLIAGAAALATYAALPHASRAQQMLMTGAGKGASAPPVTPTTWNPADKSGNLTLSNGNLRMNGIQAGFFSVRSVASKSSGKYYWEITAGTLNGPDALGVANSSAGLNNFVGADAFAAGYYFDGRVFINAATITTFASWTTGDVIGFALDTGAQTIQFLKNGASQGTVGISGFSAPYFAMGGVGTNLDALTANFGATSFAFTPPGGFGILG